MNIIFQRHMYGHLWKVFVYVNDQEYILHAPQSLLSLPDVKDGDNIKIKYSRCYTIAEFVYKTDMHNVLVEYPRKLDIVNVLLLMGIALVCLTAILPSSMQLWYALTLLVFLFVIGFCCDRFRKCYYLTFFE